MLIIITFKFYSNFMVNKYSFKQTVLILNYKKKKIWVRKFSDSKKKFQRYFKYS